MKTILLLLLLTFNLCAQQSSDGTRVETFELYFDFNADEPTAASNADLESWIKNNRDAEIFSITGYADSVDASGYNRELSERRIKAVLRLLSGKEIMISNALVTNPVGENFTQSSEQWKNRKVVFEYRNLAGAVQVSGEIDHSKTLPSGHFPDEVRQQFAKAKKGDIIRLHNIQFYLNSEKVVESSEPLLEELYGILTDYPNLKIEIHGHICCNPNINDTRLSYRRAKFIFSYLLGKGIPLNRLGYKGFGSSRPIWPIPEQDEAQEEMNRRVEILITKSAL